MHNILTKQLYYLEDDSAKNLNSAKQMSFSDSATMHT